MKNTNASSVCDLLNRNVASCVHIFFSQFFFDTENDSNTLHMCAIQPHLCIVDCLLRHL